MKIAYIIVHFHSVKDTTATISDLEKNLLPPGTTQTIYLVDNAQEKALPQAIKQFKSVIFIPSPTNSGFAAGNNLGLKQAVKDGADILVMINNDTIVPPNLTKQIFRSPILDPTVGVVGGMIYFAPGFEFENHYQKSEIGKVIWYAGGILDWDNVYASHRGVNDVDKNQYSTVEETDFVTGCLFVVRTDTLKTVGFLDEKYCLYLEDSDLGLRIKQAGYKLIFDPSIKIWHKVAQSSGIGSPLNDYFLTRNRLLFGFKYASLRTRFALFRESMKKLFLGTHAQKVAIKDFYFHNLGKGSWLK